MDLIDREQAIKHLQNKLVEAQMYSIGFLAEVYDDIARHHIAQWVNEIPSARPKGKWIEYPTADGMNQCSECGVLRFGESNYCPNCGADMRGVE